MATKSAFSKKLARVGFAVCASFGLGPLAAAETARADSLETLNPGVLQVAIEPYMPYTALKDVSLSGSTAIFSPRSRANSASRSRPA